MSSAYDAIVIGAGANGLTAAAALARGGKRVLVLDGADDIGGQLRTLEFAPGFRAAPLGVDAGWVPPMVTAGIGLNLSAPVAPEISATVAALDGGFLSVASDPARAATAIRHHSARDAERWSAFVARIRALSGFLEALYSQAPPDVGARSLAQIAPLLGLGRRFRALGRDGMQDLLRVLPMAVDELLDDEFESVALKAAVAAGGVRDIRQGPRSGGTAFVLLHYLTGAPRGSVRARGWWREGPDAVIVEMARAARAAGATIRTGESARVARIVIRDDAVTGVALANGDQITAPIVVSTADPSRTLLGMVDPVWLDPDFLHAVRNIKYRGCTAIVCYALDRLPETPGLENASAALASVVSLTPSVEALERAYDAAKYGNVSSHPHVEITVPTLRWPSLAPAGQHVLVAKVQYAPYVLRNDASWDAERSAALGAAATDAIVRIMPRFADAVLHRTVLNPRDLERQFSLTEGAASHGEMTLDQILFMRPVAGSGRYAMPVSGLFLGGSGAHPGAGVLGAAGWLAAQQVLTRAVKR